jgi:hypothetical protein
VLELEAELGREVRLKLALSPRSSVVEALELEGVQELLRVSA